MRSSQTLRVSCAIGVVKLAPLAMWVSLALASPTQAAESTWPRQFDSPAGSFVIYQPQPENLTGDLLTGRTAFSLQRSGDDNPIFGVLWFTEHIQIDRDSSTVTPRDFDVTKVRLPGITPADATRYEHLVETEASRWDLAGSIEELKVGLASAEKERASVANLDNAPPLIRFVYERAILVVYDGPPDLEPIAGTRLERVANTPFAVVYDPTTRSYYLNGANLWYVATDPLGPWVDLANPPRAVAEAVPPDTSSDDQVDGPPPRVVTATVPTELIAIDGQPEYASLVGDELLYVTNTESDVVREVRTQRLYVLIAGRWYRAESTRGPWEFVRGDSLPASFARVPPDSPKGHILASVAGTDQADDAVADAEIPQTSAIRRNGAFFEVIYDGPARFEPIEGTDMEYAVNTDAEVIRADLRYFACDQGAWYVAGTPYGPWSVSDTRPLGVDDILPECPLYDVRYVYVYDSTPDVVYMGYLPAYVGSYPYYGCVVYGTGFRYRSWRSHQHYYPRPWTWGCLPRYNPWLSRWSFGYSYGSGFFRVAARWASGTRSPVVRRWFGPGGFHRPLVGEDRTPLRKRPPEHQPARVADRLPMNLYRRTRNSVRVDPVASRRALIPIARPAPRSPWRPNDVFAGRDGKVYRREAGGSWKVNVGRAWRPTVLGRNVPGTPAPSGRDAANRSRSWGGRGVEAPPQPTPTFPTTQPPHREWPPAPRPSAPPVSPDPGDLEREFRGRERAGNGGAASPAPARDPAPRQDSSPLPGPQSPSRPAPPPPTTPLPQTQPAAPQTQPAPQPPQQQLPPASKP